MQEINKKETEQLNNDQVDWKVVVPMLVAMLSFIVYAIVHQYFMG
jgi:hypothetical protein